MRAWVFVPLLLAAVLGLHYLGKREQAATAPAAALVAREPGEDWSGIWAEAKSAALLKLKHGLDDRLSGEYMPPGNRPIVCRFGGRVEGEAASFPLKINGKLWNCTLTKRGGTLTLSGCKDVEALLQGYVTDDRMPNGVLIINPRDGQKRREDEARLQQKREEIKRAGGEVTTFGTFKRVER
jgi:hypothetical protein